MLLELCNYACVSVHGSPGNKNIIITKEKKNYHYVDKVIFT